MPQTEFQDDFDIARAGALYDNNDSANDRTTAIVHDSVTGFDGGCPLFEHTAGLEDGQARPIVSPAGAGAFVGIAIYTPFKMPQGYGGPTSRLYGPRDIVPVLRKGRIWCSFYGGASKNQDQLAAGTAGNLGKLSIGPGTDIPVKSYGASRAGNTFVIAEVMLPVPSLAVVTAQDVENT